ncbi:hypothetical protein ACM01_05310 [Streptomyces viridochromogenes]|uniref:NB-ARC domain-containing protein n=1 Tax=Streptomyces viridochromogenes TaxID=1938 RepID=A0A0J7ZNB0_STRVR|nr:hypothetical protein [Streptomyces viridochromogenes]KMS76588.1 hypothetical protein ACM01_05310 [Streptomyces viridochromogenes]KOG23366.1 hypothetical protein ADK35_13975 [Streptomyces viridochromogenes]KOG27026.1 hypothetical protein ADK36_00085 [Streptomyces viridochromogenes]
MAFDGGRVAARGFQYQYLRTVEALLASVRTGKAAVCRIEGPGDTVSLQHTDSVDFDLTDADGRSLMAVQVKSAGAGRTVRAREAAAVLVHLVTGIDAEQYQLITSAVPDEGCLRLAELLRHNRGDVPRIKAELKNLLVKAPAAWGICQALPEEHWERLARAGVEFDGRSDGQLRADLNDALRAERGRAGQGLSRRAGGLVLGHLVAEVLRRAADPGLADWDVRDFHRSVLVGDEELIAAVGRQEFGIVYGQLPPIPEVVRADLVDGIGEVLSPGEEGAGGVRTCVVTGLSGLGKSSLAAAHIADQAFRYDAVFWVDAESEEALVGSFARVLAHLNGSEEPAEVRDPRLVRERVHAALQSLPGRWLMVFDDASAPLASAWIPRRGQGRVIVTTLGGHWHGVQGRIDLSPMSGEEALCLLRLRLGLSESEVEQYAASLSRLAQVLECWPLAIEVACGYLVSCGIGVDRLPVYTDTLIHRAADDERSVPAGYPRTLAAAVALSTERLISGARSRGLLQPTLATVAALCWLAPRRAPVHLALASAFVGPKVLPPAPGWVVFDEAQVPVREVIRELTDVSLVRYDEPLPTRKEAFPGSDDTVSMNAVLQDILARHLGLSQSDVAAGLSHVACHTDRWLRGALLSGQAERTWELAQHATALVGHIRSTRTADGYTALLMGNLAAFHHAHGQYDAAHSLLELELEWLGRAGDPDEGLAAQAHTLLAHLAQLRKQADAGPRVAAHLRPVLFYLRQLDGPPPEPVANLAAEASRILQMRLRDQPDPALAQLLEDFRALADVLPTKTTQAVKDLLAVQDLLEQREAERAEHTATAALARSTDPWSAATADLKRLLVEALVLQDKWEQADAALSDFLPYAGPRTLYGFALHHLVHNVGCSCAWTWVTQGEQRAVELLGRLLEETGIAENPALETATDEARFILLQVVHDSWRAMNGNSQYGEFLEQMSRLNDKTFTEPYDPDSVWERIYSGLMPRLSAVMGETVHRNYQEEGDAILATGLPSLDRDPAVKDAYATARCHAVLSLSTDPVYGGLAGRSTIDLLLPEARKFLPGPKAVVILQPHKMVGATSPDTGKSIELQVHRACDKGLRRLVGPQSTLISPQHLTLVLTGQQLTLEHDDGAVIARATVRASSQWRQAARTRHSAVVYFGYGFALHDSPTHRRLMASPTELGRHINSASDNGLLAAGLVSVRLQLAPSVQHRPPATARQQPRRSTRARRRKPHR